MKTPYVIYRYPGKWAGPLRREYLNQDVLHRLFAVLIEYVWKAVINKSAKVGAIGSGYNFTKYDELAPPKEKQFALGYILDLELFDSETEPIKKPSGKEILMFHGRLAKPTGVEYMLRALPDVIERHDDIEVWIVGNGPQKEELKSMAKKLSVKDKVIFFDWVPIEKIPLYLAAADIIINPNVSGSGISSATIESMAMGKPIIKGNVNPDVEEIIVGKNCGLSFEPENIGELSEKINKLLENKDLRSKIARNAEEYARRHFSIKSHVDRWDNLLKKVVERE